MSRSVSLVGLLDGEPLVQVVFSDESGVGSENELVTVIAAILSILISNAIR